MRTEVCGLRPWRVGARPRTSAGRVAEPLALARAGAGLAGRWRCALGCAVAAAERRVPSSRRRPPLAGSFLCALARAPQRPPLSRPRFLSPAPPRRRPRRRPSATNRVEETEAYNDELVRSHSWKTVEQNQTHPVSTCLPVHLLNTTLSARDAPLTSDLCLPITA